MSFPLPLLPSVFKDRQIYPNSPKQVIDASLSDLDGDGVLDLAVLEASGPKLFVNDTAGYLSLEATKPVAQSKAIEVVDFNRDGYKDLLVATIYYQNLPLVSCKSMIDYRYRPEHDQKYPTNDSR